MSADASERKWQERVEAARPETERLGPLVAEKAKQCESLALEQVMARWAEVMQDHAKWQSYDDDFKAEVMALFQAIGVKAGAQGKMLRASGFNVGEPMQ